MIRSISTDYKVFMCTECGYTIIAKEAPQGNKCPKCGASGTEYCHAVRPLVDCPFCGMLPDVIVESADDYYIRCSNCCIQTPPFMRGLFLWDYWNNSYKG